MIFDQYFCGVRTLPDTFWHEIPCLRWSVVRGLLRRHAIREPTQKAHFWRSSCRRSRDRTDTDEEGTLPFWRVPITKQISKSLTTSVGLRETEEDSTRLQRAGESPSLFRAVCQSQKQRKKSWQKYPCSCHVLGGTRHDSMSTMRQMFISSNALSNTLSL